MRLNLLSLLCIFLSSVASQSIFSNTIELETLIRNDEGKLAIGVDSNQNHLQPGTMLTSMLKRVDLATYETFMDVKNNNFTSGVKSLGLAEDGVGWALDEHNASLVSDSMKSKVTDLSDKVKSGSIKVHDYMSDNNCPS